MKKGCKRMFSFSVGAAGQAERMHYRALTLATFVALALFARAGEAQTSRPTKVDVAPAAGDAIIRRSAPDSKVTTRPASGVAPAPVGFDTTRVAVSLAIVIVLILMLRWASKRMFGRTVLGRSSRAVHVLSRTVISPKQQLLVVQVGRRLVVIGDSGQQMSPLCEITDPEEIAALVGQIQEEKRDTVSNTFGALFGRAGSHFEKEVEPRQPVDAGNAGGAPDLSSQEKDTRDELNGLMDKVRVISRDFRRT